MTESGFRSRSANSWLLGREAARRCAEDGRRRPGCPRMSAFLALEDGTIFRGESVGAAGAAFGEAVFTTAMTGYQETVTDPSFAEQLICFTAPMVGNYGVAAGRAESTGAHAKAVLMREARGPEWTSWLQEHGIVALTGIDTRSLVLRLRDGGAMRAVAAAGRSDEADALDAVRARPTDGRRSARRPGLDARAVRLLRRGHAAGRRRSTTAASARSCAASPAPARTSPSSRTRSMPRSCSPTTPSCSRTAPATRSRSPTRSQVVRELLGRVPVLGICLGHQLLGLATGHETYKLPFGHRGANHPVLERRSGRVLVTSQNHGFAVAPSDERRGDARLALRRHRRGLRLPRAAGALGPVPPGGGARPARRLADPRALGRGGARCRVGRTSSRSA